MTHVLGLLSWNPEIRNILALSLGIIILMGSVVLLISTNTGPRTGVLIGLACLLGWLSIMGLIWWMYGIGMKGTPSHWRVLDVNVGSLQTDPLKQAEQLPSLDEQRIVAAILAKHPDLEAKVNPDATPNKVTTIGELIEADPAVRDEFHLQPSDLGGWHLLVPSDKQRGDAQAVADSALGPDGQKIFSASSDYKVLDAFDLGGKENDYAVPAHSYCGGPWDVRACLDHVANFFATSFRTHPEHFAIVQVQAVVPQETPPGGKPPTPILDQSQPVISIVMIRSLGDLRFPGFMLFLIAGVLFVLTCNTLHRRDKAIARNRAAVT